MMPPPLPQPTPVVLALAAALVVAGAPLFSGGLRAFRLRRAFRRLAPARWPDTPTGLVRLSGRVVLDSPLFSPLSQRPCAGYTLEVIAEGGGLSRTITEHRSFRVAEAGGSARIHGGRPRWELRATAERVVTRRDPVSVGLERLLARVPEAGWWRRTGGTLVLVERALLDGASVHVVGTARPPRPLERPESGEVEEVALRTGTDGHLVAAAAPRASVPDVDLWVDSGEHLDYLLVCDREPPAAHFDVPWWRTLGLVVGPLLGLAGLIYLANAVDHLRALGRS